MLDPTGVVDSLSIHVKTERQQKKKPNFLTHRCVSPRFVVCVTSRAHLCRAEKKIDKKQLTSTFSLQNRKHGRLTSKKKGGLLTERFVREIGVLFEYLPAMLPLTRAASQSVNSIFRLEPRQKGRSRWRVFVTQPEYRGVSLRWPLSSHFLLPLLESKAPFDTRRPSREAAAGKSLDPERIDKMVRPRSAQ